MTAKPLILLTNDDGIEAPGILALLEFASEVGDPWVVAPVANRSGASHSITLTQALPVEKRAPRQIAIGGTPVDCVLMALRTFLPRKPDWVWSGINRGPNLGDDTLYSGTVGAALAAFEHDVPAIAMSLAGITPPMHYETAVHVLRGLWADKNFHRLAQKGVYNINTPNVPISELKGVRATTLGRRHYDQGFIADPVVPNAYWYGEVAPGHDNRPETDSSAIEQNFASVSVLRPHLLDEALTKELQGAWKTKF